MCLLSDLADCPLPLATCRTPTPSPLALVLATHRETRLQLAAPLHRVLPPWPAAPMAGTSLPPAPPAGGHVHTPAPSVAHISAPQHHQLALVSARLHHQPADASSSMPLTRAHHRHGPRGVEHVGRRRQHPPGHQFLSAFSRQWALGCSGLLA